MLQVHSLLSLVATEIFYCSGNCFSRLEFQGSEGQMGHSTELGGHNPEPRALWMTLQCGHSQFHGDWRRQRWGSGVVVVGGVSAALIKSS